MECDYIISINPGPTAREPNGEKRNISINKCTSKATFFFLIMKQKLIMRCRDHVNDDDTKEVVIHIRGEKAISISEEEAETFEILSV